MDVFMGTILAFGFDYAPRGWALCAGQILPISQNSALFSLLGTRYGGNGSATFGLPSLQGRVPVGQGTGPGLSPYTMGQIGGTETTTLSIPNMPTHNHAIAVNNTDATSPTPGGTMVLGQANGSDPANGDAITVNVYTPAAANAQLAPSSVSLVGGNQAFNNLSPYLTINYSIALEGIYPSRN